MLIVKQSNDRSVAASWKGVIRDDKRTAGMTCPNGHTASLSDHTIAADGKVSPSVVCPYEGCKFHEYVQLEGWGSSSTVSIPAPSVVLECPQGECLYRGIRAFCGPCLRLAGRLDNFTPRQKGSE